MGGGGGGGVHLPCICVLRYLVLTVVFLYVWTILFIMPWTVRRKLLELWVPCDVSLSVGDKYLALTYWLASLLHPPLSPPPPAGRQDVGLLYSMGGC